jgi:hypothetical protein
VEQAVRVNRWKEPYMSDKGLKTPSQVLPSSTLQSCNRICKMQRKHSIVNPLLVEKLLGLIERLKETKGMRIFKT